MQVESVVLSSGQTADVISNGEVPPQAGVVLLHGSGTSERLSLRSIGVALAERGIAVVTPDRHPSGPGDSVTPALDFADDVFGRLGLTSAQRVIAGYSAGGRVALGLTVNPSARFNRCIALASSSFQPSAAHPDLNVERRVQVLLIHGDADVIRPSSDSERIRDDLAKLGIDAGVTVIAEGTHASVVCASYEPRLQLSNPAAHLDPPMLATVDAIAEFVLA